MAVVKYRIGLASEPLTGFSFVPIDANRLCVLARSPVAPRNVGFRVIRLYRTYVFGNSVAERGAFQPRERAERRSSVENALARDKSRETFESATR